MENKLKILAIAGSLRKNSFNKHLLNAAIKLMPENLETEIFDIKDVPLYNQDLDGEHIPEAVKIFKEKIAGADALLIATPEYNYSIPGVLKNALDWASRPGGKSPLAMKPLGIMGTSGGPYGTVRAQLHLRQFAFALNMMDMKKPEMIIPRYSEKFDNEGNLTDEATKEHLVKFLKSFEVWINIFRK